MGGMIGQTFTLKYPERVSALVLADTTSAHTTTPLSMWNDRIRIASEQGMEPLVQPAIERWFTESFRTQQPATVAKVAQMISHTSVAGWSGCCAAIAASLFGVAKTPLSAALVIQRHLKQSTLVVISDAAHMTDVEQPLQFNRALKMFLAFNFNSSDSV